MRRLLLAVLLVAAPAHAATYFLVDEWFKGGDQFCRYSNGTVLNVGPRVCPETIKAR